MQKNQRKAVPAIMGYNTAAETHLEATRGTKRTMDEAMASNASAPGWIDDLADVPGDINDTNRLDRDEGDAYTLLFDECSDGDDDDPLFDGSGSESDTDSDTEPHTYSEIDVDTEVRDKTDVPVPASVTPLDASADVGVQPHSKKERPDDYVDDIRLR